jgi:outer membrane biosynthesis protein TonB
MERQAGLGRSLEDVLDSLAPVEADPGAPGRVLFEPRDLERQVDQLAAEIGDVRERVQRLVGLVSDAAVVNGTTNGTHQEATDSEGDTEATATPSAETPKQPEQLDAEQHKDKNKKKKKNKKAKAKNKTAKHKKKAEQKSGNG